LREEGEGSTAKARCVDVRIRGDDGARGGSFGRGGGVDQQRDVVAAEQLDAGGEQTSAELDG
jgi:hypothetical protein